MFIGADGSYAPSAAPAAAPAAAPTTGDAQPPKDAWRLRVQEMLPGAAERDSLHSMSKSKLKSFARSTCKIRLTDERRFERDDLIELINEHCRACETMLAHEADPRPIGLLISLLMTPVAPSLGRLPDEYLDAWRDVSPSGALLNVFKQTFPGPASRVLASISIVAESLAAEMPEHKDQLSDHKAEYYQKKKLERERRAQANAVKLVADVEGREDVSAFLAGDEPRPGTRLHALCVSVDSSPLFKTLLARVDANAAAVAEKAGQSEEAVLEHGRSALLRLVVMSHCGIRASRRAPGLEGSFETMTVAEIGLCLEGYFYMSPNRYVGDPATSARYAAQEIEPGHARYIPQFGHDSLSVGTAAGGQILFRETLRPGNVRQNMSALPVQMVNAYMWGTPDSQAEVLRGEEHANLTNGTGVVYIYVPTIQEAKDAGLITLDGDLTLFACKRVSTALDHTMDTSFPPQARGIVLTRVELRDVNNLAKVSYTPSNNALYTKRACELEDTTCFFNVHPVSFRQPTGN